MKHAHNIGSGETEVACTVIRFPTYALSTLAEQAVVKVYLKGLLLLWRIPAPSIKREEDAHVTSPVDQHQATLISERGAHL